MSKNWNRWIVFYLLAFYFFAAGSAYAGADELAKDVDKIIRNAERKMFGGKNDEADALLREAAVMLDQARAQDPANKLILRAEKNYERIRKNVDRKLGQSAGQTSSQVSAAPAAVSVPSGGTDLPGGVRKRLKDISRHLDRAERYASSDAKQTRYQLDQAEELFREVDKMYSGQYDPEQPDYAAARGRYDKLSRAAAERGSAEARASTDAADAEANKEKQSREWVARFRQYLSYPGQEGHDPGTLVFVPGTSEAEKFADAKRRYEAFKTFYRDYKKTEFPNGKTWELENLADHEAPSRLEQFEEGFSRRVGSVVDSAEREIDVAMAQLDKDNGWRSDGTIKPNVIDSKRMESINEATKNVISALGADDPKAQQVQAEFSALVSKDKENRQIRRERTFMQPNRYTGDDAEALKKKAEALVRADEKEGGTPLRSTIISEYWKEETVEEWADTSKTEWRRRTTRRVTAQVAASTSDGVRLITVALAQDKQSDGTWGPLYGNLHQYSDPMLESNVNKNGP